jgi:hypothetical protein
MATAGQPPANTVDVPKEEKDLQVKNQEVDITSAANTGPKKYLNGWTRELETLFAEWADKASCYRWMHEKTGRMYQTRDQGFMFPIIILSTVGGAANFAMNSISNDATIQKYIQLGLGGLSIATGILTTIANRLGYASSSEAHRGASISWGKFGRLIVIELSLHPDERMEAFAFMKMFRIELDRLIEQSPSIPEAIINKFIYEFKEEIDLKKPDITGDLHHTKVFSDSGTRLKKMAEDAALTLNLKKGILKQLVLDELDAKVRSIVRQSIKNPSPTNTPQNLTIQVPRSGTSSGLNSSKEPISQGKIHKTEMVANISRATLPLVSSANASVNSRIKNPLLPTPELKAEVEAEVGVEVGVEVGADVALEIPNVASQDDAASGTNPESKK